MMDKGGITPEEEEDMRISVEEYRYGWNYLEDGTVLAGGEGAGSGWIVVEGGRPDERNYASHTRGVEESIQHLWQKLGPVKFFDRAGDNHRGVVEIDYGTQLFHEGDGAYYEAEKIEMGSHPDIGRVPKITFSQKDSNILKVWTGPEIRDMLEDRVLKTMQEVHEELMGKMESDEGGD